MHRCVVFATHVETNTQCFVNVGIDGEEQILDLLQERLGCGRSGRNVHTRVFGIVCNPLLQTVQRVLIIGFVHVAYREGQQRIKRLWVSDDQSLQAHNCPVVLVVFSVAFSEHPPRRGEIRG